MKISILPCSFDNYSYLVVCEQTGLAAVVDPTEAYPVLREAGQGGVELTAVLCTHHHGDHIGGLEDLLAELPDLEVYGHSSDQDRIPEITHPLADGTSLAVGELAVEVMHTPGHTDGSLVYVVGDNLFTGDTLFGAGCGRLFEGTAEQMQASLNRIVSNRSPEAKLYFGHEYTLHNLRFAREVEPENEAVARRLADVTAQRAEGMASCPSTLGEELATNPFLRCSSQVLSARLQQLTGVRSGSAVEVFAALRLLRNNF